MAIHCRPLVLGSIAVLTSCGEPTLPTSGAPAIPIAPVTPVGPVAAAIDLGLTPFAVDDSGVPRLLRGGAATLAMPAADATTSAVMHVERIAPAWGVASAAVPQLERVGEVGTPAGTVVRLRQVIDGIPVDPNSGGEVRVLVGSSGELVAASGKLVASDAPRGPLVDFAVEDDAEAVAIAMADLYRTSFVPGALATRSTAADGTRMLAADTGPVNVSLSRARKAWVPDGGKLTVAWVVEAYSSTMATTDGDAYRTVVAADGRVLSRTNLKEDVAFTYRVYADATGDLRPGEGPIVDVSPHNGSPNTIAYPAYATPNLVTVEGLNRNPAGLPDPWLAQNRTETFGNNVDAYIDINAPDGLTLGDFRATVTSLRTFDRSYDPLKGAFDTQSQQMAGVQQLFYTINWLHDFWYNAGFTEAAGNGQNGNFGRGGEDRDAMNAEGQDNALGGSRNNANMSTPADGFPPRMQVFIWDNKDDRTLSVSGRKPPTGASAFGDKQFELTAPVVLANDNDTTGGGTTSDACQPLGAEAAGKIVLVDRGICSFKLKALTVQNAGGLAIIIANNVEAANPPALTEDAAITIPILIGAVSVTQAEGTLIKADLVAGPVTAQMKRAAEPDLEGTLDGTVVAHEFGHYWHHRLSVCNGRLCGAQSEGWGDFLALMLMVSEGDNFASGGFPVGTYSTRGRAADPVYFGIRRAPYSASFDVNPLTFRHMADDQLVPTGTPAHPVRVSTAVNSEVHNAGEVWTAMLWQGYSALLQQPGADFKTVRSNMARYVTSGLLIAPIDATPTETRDAILTATHAENKVDHEVLAAAFASRGFGSCAISPPRNSTTFVGIVEDFTVKGRLAPGGPALQSVAKCDTDNVLDGGETARITVPIANPGAAALADVTVTLASTTPGITISQPTRAVGAIDAYGTATATFNIQLDDSVTTALAGDFKVTITTSNGCTTTVDLPLAIPLHTDDQLEASATDTFDASATVWTAIDGESAEAGRQWARARRGALDGFFHGADPGTRSDASLISPPLTAGAGPVTITFDHRFDFEANANNAFDGGALELSLDAGATWQDISQIADPGYNVTLAGSVADTSSNPLAGRRAFGRRNPAFPMTDTVTVNLGTALAGKAFLLRFRIGTDTGTGGEGWDIDNLAFSGIVGTPFPKLAPDAGHCNAVQDPGPGTPPPSSPPSGGPPGDPVEPTVDEGGCQAGGSGAGLALGLLAVLLRRRRR
jgi:large repetitive protein